MNAPLIREATPELALADIGPLHSRESAYDALNAVEEASQRWDEMFEAATRFDGSYEAARARFHVLFGEIGK